MKGRIKYLRLTCNRWIWDENRVQKWSGHVQFMLKISQFGFYFLTDWCSYSYLGHSVLFWRPFSMGWQMGKWYWGVYTVVFAGMWGYCVWKVLYKKVRIPQILRCHICMVPMSFAVWYCFFLTQIHILLLVHPCRCKKKKRYIHLWPVDVMRLERARASPRAVIPGPIFLCILCSLCAAVCLYVWGCVTLSGL